MRKLHYPSEGDYPKTSGDFKDERHPVLAYTYSLGWTVAIRKKKGKKYEWYCSNYDGNTIFFDNEVLAWQETPPVILVDKRTENDC